MSEKRDFKLFREKIGGRQERYIARRNQEYIALLQREDHMASENFLDLYKKMKQDKRDAGVAIYDLTKSNFDLYLMILLNEGAITMEDLEDFSDELKQSMKQHIENQKKIRRSLIE